MKKTPELVLLISLLWGQSVVAKDVEFEREIQPILESACIQCHNEERDEGGLRLDTLEAALTGGDSGPALVPGKPEESPLYTYCVLPIDDDLIMPPDEPVLSPWQTQRLKAWISEGSVWPEGKTLGVRPRIDFARHIQPILEVNCVSVTPVMTRRRVMTSRIRSLHSRVVIRVRPSFLFRPTIVSASR